jgi:hypothetical protein
MRACSQAATIGRDAKNVAWNAKMADAPSMQESDVIQACNLDHLPSNCAHPVKISIAFKLSMLQQEYNC